MYKNRSIYTKYCTFKGRYCWAMYTLAVVLEPHLGLTLRRVSKLGNEWKQGNSSKSANSFPFLVLVELGKISSCHRLGRVKWRQWYAAAAAPCISLFTLYPIPKLLISFVKTRPPPHVEKNPKLFFIGNHSICPTNMCAIICLYV